MHAHIRGAMFSLSPIGILLASAAPKAARGALRIVVGTTKRNPGRTMPLYAADPGRAQEVLQG